MYQPLRSKHVTIDELSEELLNLINHLNTLFSAGDTIPTKADGKHGSLRIFWDGTTMRVYVKAGRKQSSTWKYKTFNDS